MTSQERLRSILQVARYFNYKSWNYYESEMNKTIENYFGVLIPVTLNSIKDKSEEKKYIFVKIPPIDQCDSLRDVIRQHYSVEIHTYSYLLPIYRSITNVDINKLIPECYYTSVTRDVLVLKDMTYDGYTRYEGKKFLDFDHCIVSLKALAQFHSLSMIYKEKANDFNNEMMQPYTSEHPKPYHEYIRNSMHNHIPVFKATKYEDYYNTLVEDLDSFVNSSTSEAYCLIYGHGDFWRENILFKYKDAKPVQACLIDFQKSRLMSPAQDVLQFLLGNVDSSTTLEHHKYFFKIYLIELQKTLKENGVDNVYTTEDLNHDMKIVSPACIAITTMAYSLWLGLENGDEVKSKHVCNNDKNVILFSFKEKVIEMLDNLKHFGFITLQLCDVKQM